jgi:hypothetical protein
MDERIIPQSENEQNNLRPDQKLMEKPSRG